MSQTNYKIIMVGESGAGKTTIVQRLVYGVFNEDLTATIGVEFKSCTIKANGKNVKLQIWDTAGQEKFRSVAKSYFRNAIGALIVFDLTSMKSFDSVIEWLSDVQTLSHPNSVVILVGNKCDLTDKRSVSRKEAEALAERNNILYFETSAKDGTLINEIFIRMATEISNKIDSGALIPPQRSQPPSLYTDPRETKSSISDESGQCAC